MLVRLPKSSQPYTNALQLAGIFLQLEFVIAMGTIGIYHNETETWSFRRAFWYVTLVTPALLSLAAMVGASVKYLLRG